MLRLLTTLTLATSVLLLSGCDLRERFGSAEDRINGAVPLAIDVRQAHERLVEQLGDQKDARAAADSAWAGRLRARAASCSPDFTPTWRHSGEQVRAAVANKACFAEFDAKLGRWVGAQRVRLLLAQAPITAATLPPSLTLPGRLASVSANAAVLAAASSGGWLELLTLEGPRTLLKERVAGGTVHLSPNGRLFAHLVSGVARIRVVEGGETLLELPGTRAIDWLGPWVLGVHSSNGGKPASLFSLNTAEEVPVVAQADGSHSYEALLPVPGSDKRFNWLTGFGMYQLEASEEGGKLSIAVVAEKPGPLRHLNDITFGRGHLSVDGRSWVLASHGLLSRLDLNTLESQETVFEPMEVEAVIPTRNPDRFVLEMRAPMDAATPSARAKYLYDAKAGSLALVEGVDAQQALRYLPGVGRLARVGEPTVWLVEDVKTAEPRALADQVSAWLDAVNQAKLNRALAEEQRMAASPALQAGSPLAATLRDAQVEGIGIYEAREKAARPGQARSVGRVSVNVRRTARPLVLVLTAYEPVEWNLRLEPGARLGAVLVGGYYDATVTGAGEARVLKIGATYAYKQDGPEFAALQREVARWAGRPIALFQSGYHGSSYSVGGR